MHRIGRTGLAGENCVALSLVCAEEISYLASIEKLTKQLFKKEIIKDFEPDSNASVLLPKKGGGGQRHVGGQHNNKRQGTAGVVNSSKHKRRR